MKGSLSKERPPLKKSSKIHTTVQERVYIEIKGMIARGELAPGTPLILRPLAVHLGVSHMPVVEAIRRLERDGLVTVIAKRGAAVKRWTREEILESYHIRRALESEAARLFVMRATPADKKRLVTLSELFDKYATSDPLRCNETDIELHLHIVRSTSCKRLYELVANSKIETTLAYGLRLTPAELAMSYKQSIGIHRPLIEALLGKDPEKAEQEMKRSIDTLLDVLRRMNERQLAVS